VVALAVTQTVGYGVLYYAFSVFLLSMARDLRTATAGIAAALTPRSCSPQCLRCEWIGCWTPAA
jgi:hypothetical protein